MRTYFAKLAVLLGVGLSVSSQAYACACGCGAFDIGLPGGLGLPTNPAGGGAINVQATFLNQNTAFSGNQKIPLSQSPDQQIVTQFYNLNMQYNFNRDWGVMAMVPYWKRDFTTNTNFGNGLPQNATYNANTLSDIRLLGMYTGFSDDMSKGLLFGLKLPTGTYSTNGFDRDTQPGTGTTDALLGYYQIGQYRTWGWFFQGMGRVALNYQQGYRPGDSVQLVLGSHYDNVTWNPKLVPLLQINATWRAADSGISADPPNSGLKVAYLTPGLLYNFTNHWQANGLVYLPLYRYVTGIQLVPLQIVSAGVSYVF